MKEVDELIEELMTETNGEYHASNSTKLDKLSSSIDGLCDRIDTFMEFANNAIPTKVVYIIFGLVFALLFGIEAAQFLFTKFLPKFYGL